MDMVECSTCGQMFSRASAERVLRQDILKPNKPNRREGPAQFSAHCPSCGGVTLRQFGVHVPDPNDQHTPPRKRFKPDREIVGREASVAIYSGDPVIE